MAARSKQRPLSRGKYAQFEPPCAGKGGVPLTVQWACRRQKSSYLPAWHDDLEIQYIRHGLGWYFINGKACAFGDHFLLFIQPRETHHLALADQVLLSKCCLMLNPRYFHAELSLAGPLTRLPHVLRLSPAAAGKVEWILQQMSAEYEARQPQRAAMLRILLGGLFINLRRLAGGTGDKALASGADLPLLVAELVDFLEQNFRRAVSGAELRRRFGYAPDHLSRLLRRRFGCGFKQYLMARRLAEAKYLLREHPQMKIAAVAETAGFRSFALFSRVFRRAEGMPPGMYRHG